MYRVINFLLILFALVSFSLIPEAYSKNEKPNILVIWGDDIGLTNLSYNTQGMMGYKTPNIDRVVKEGMTFTDYYGEQSCTAGRASFITGQTLVVDGGLMITDYPSLATLAQVGT